MDKPQQYGPSVHALIAVLGKQDTGTGRRSTAALHEILDLFPGFAKEDNHFAIAQYDKIVKEG